MSAPGAGSQVAPRPDGAVRVLHTSDWHLGVTVRNHPRADDHEALVAEVASVAAAARPDLIVHTGDLFDGPRPPLAELSRAIRALRTLAEVAPVVLLAGNHDSPAALDVLAVALGDDHADDVAAGRYRPHEPVRQRIRIHARPTVPEKGSVATYATACGARLRLAALPFVHANRVLVDFAHLCEPNATYNDSLRRIIGALAAVCLDGFDPTGEVAVFASHLHVAGAATSSEKTIHVSEDYAADATHLAPAYGYLAFGHIHVPQAVAGGRGRYAGSLLEVDFGEVGEPKQVVLADLEPGRPTRVTPVTLTAGRRLHRVAAPLDRLADLAAGIGTGIVEVTVTPDPDGATLTDGPVAVGEATFDTLSAAVRALLPDAAVVSVVDGRNPRVRAADEVEVPAAPESMEDAFRSWLVERGDAVLAAAGHGRARPARVAELFAELRAAVASGEPALPSEAAALDGLGAGGG